MLLYDYNAHYYEYIVQCRMVHVQRMENALQLLQDHQAQIDQLTREMENMKTGSEVTPVGGTVTYCTVRLTGSGITAIPPVGVTYLQ